MANVAHASLTGAELHEPKGITSAALGEVYVANGAGSGSWASVGTSSFTGMVADFAAPVAPSGWLELDGSTISTSTYSALFAVMSITTSGSRTNGSPIITSIASTSTYKAGYYVFGTGISSGTTIVSVDSPTQITLSNNASSGGTASFYVSPWLMNTGTVKLPDVTTSGRYRRSRTSSTKVGDLQADQNQAHTHSLSVSGTTASDGSHWHTATAVDAGHTHSYPMTDSGQLVTSGNGSAGHGIVGNAQTGATSYANVSVTVDPIGAHTHTVTSTGTSGSTGSTEARPLSIVLLTCVKT